MTLPEFLSRFLYVVEDDEPYWVPGKPPSPETISQAAAAAKDIFGFEAHQKAFVTLAEVIDVCTAEELECKGHGIAARNATKHPRVIELGQRPPEERASVAAAAAQGLGWMENCRAWVNDVTLRNQIAKRVMCGIVIGIGRIKKGYSGQQIEALTRIGAGLKDDDVFVVRVRGAIVEILAGYLASLPRDAATLARLEALLKEVANASNAAPVLKSMDKLLELLPQKVATQLSKKASQWR